MCGAMNPIGNAYCDKCSARLIPMAAQPPEETEHKPAPIKGLSLPTIPLDERETETAEDIIERLCQDGKLVAYDRLKVPTKIGEF